MALNDAIDSAF